MLVNPFPYTHKANGTCQKQSSGPWAEVHTIEARVLPMGNAKNASKPDPPSDTLRPGWDGSRHAAHVPVRVRLTGRYTEDTETLG